MSEFSNINLVLGIIGTITGAIALFISYWIYRKENPRLEMSVSKCEHDFTLSTSQVKTISFWVTFQIKNLGDRGTSINDVGLFFRSNGNHYRLKKRYFRGLTVESERKWINAHETMDIEADFYETYEGNDKTQIECTFSVYHTHGAKKVTTVSQKRGPQPPTVIYA
jgi:hypothetical protein